MASVNKVIIVGNLGADPDVKTFDNGGKIANISVATTDRWTDRNTGEQREATEWHRITFNDRLADIVAQYLRKGSQVYVEGSLKTRKWQDPQTGQDRYTTEIRATSMQMLGSRPSGGDNYQNGGYQNNYNNQQPQNFQNGGNFAGNQFAGNAGFNHSNNPANFPTQNSYPQASYNQAAQNPMPQNTYPQNNMGQSSGYNPTINTPPQATPQANAFGSPNNPQPPTGQGSVPTPQPLPADDDMPF